MLTEARSARAADVVEHTQVWFGTDERPLYGWVSTPAGGQARAGVVLCLPLGEEGRSAHRTYRRLAAALAEQGLVALRFDYDGTGDSAGLPFDPDRVDSWLGSIAAARQYLLDLGVPRVDAVGMRLGATLAATRSYAAPFGSLVLWDPCLSGRTWLREGEALFSFGEDAGVRVDDGLRHTPGFQYDAATATALRSVDLAAIPTDRPLADRTLLLLRDDRPTPDAIATRLTAEGDRLSVAHAIDQDRLLDLAPSDNFVPERAVTDVVNWLVAGTSGLPAVPLRAPEPEHPVLVASTGPGSAPVREVTRRFGPVRLYGIVDEPVAPVAPTQPWVVLINVAAEHHIGPGRRWVEFSRAWAGMGYRCVRIDQSGIGDSPTRPGQLEDEAFTPQWLDDLPEIIGELHAGGAPVLLVGLCSGAYSSLEAAQRSPVAGIFAVNPRLTLYDAAKGSPLHTPARKAGFVPNAPFARLARQHRVLAGGLWRIYRQLAVWHAPFLGLLRTARRGTALTVLACREDAQHFSEVVFWRPRLWWLRRRDPHFELVADDVFDHSLLTRPGQEETFERATEFLQRRHEELG